MADIDEIRLRAEQAKELKDDPAFSAAILALRKQWFGELMASTHAEQSMRMTHRLQALEAIPQQLQVFLNDYEMAKRKK